MSDIPNLESLSGSVSIAISRRLNFPRHYLNANASYFKMAVISRVTIPGGIAHEREG